MSAISALFWSKVDRTGGPDACWPYLEYRDRHGYGQFHVARRPVKAYRFAYEDAVGPVPEGLVLDHLCTNPPCCNPRHLEPKTQAANVLRSEINPIAEHARQIHCIKGHVLDEANTRIQAERGRAPKRVCRACHRERMRARYHAERAA